MQTSRDHVQAHQFMTRRLVSALVTGDVTGNEMPARRAALGLVFGVLAALLAMGGFWLYGLISPGGNSAWRQPGSIVLEKETGNRYLFLDGRLHPVANYSSALLGAGPNAQLRSVSRNSLKGVEHGPPIGIPGAPDLLPEPTRMVSKALLVCVPVRSEDEDPARTTLVIDPAVKTTAVPRRSRLRVVDPEGREYLVLGGVGYRLRTSAVTVALGLDTTRPIPVPSTWIKTLHTGRDVAPVTVEDAGDGGPRVAGEASRLGDLFEVMGGTGAHRYYLALADGLAPISPTEFALLAVEGARPNPITAADVAAAPRSAVDSLLDRFPDLLGGAPVDPPPTLCLRQPLKPLSPKTTQAQAAKELVSVPAGTLTGKSVQVAPDSGLLAVSETKADSKVLPFRYVVTDLGVKHYVPGDQELRALRLGDAVPVVVPDHLLTHIRSGPALSFKAATGARNGVT